MIYNFNVFLIVILNFNCDLMQRVCRNEYVSVLIRRAWFLVRSRRSRYRKTRIPGRESTFLIMILLIEMLIVFNMILFADMSLSGILDGNQYLVPIKNGKSIP